MKTERAKPPEAVTHRPPLVLENKVLGFTWRSDQQDWYGQPLFLFRPRGLLIWGNDLAGAKLEQCLLGHYHEVLASSAPAPARFFSTGKSYAEIIENLKNGIEPGTWVTFKTMEIGHALSIVIKRCGRSLGPDDGIELCVWGSAAV